MLWVWPEQLGERPPRPSVDEVRKVIGSFREATGSSFDSLRPRELQLLDDEGSEAHK